MSIKQHKQHKFNAVDYEWKEPLIVKQPIKLRLVGKPFNIDKMIIRLVNRRKIERPEFAISIGRVQLCLRYAIRYVLFPSYTSTTTEKIYLIEDGMDYLIEILYDCLKHGLVYKEERQYANHLPLTKLEIPNFKYKPSKTYEVEFYCDKSFMCKLKVLCTHWIDYIHELTQEQWNP